MSSLSNQEIATLFNKVAQMLSIRGDNIHRVLAYQRAAESIGELSQSLSQLQQEGALTTIPHVGATLAEKIEEILATSKLQFYEKLAQEIPPTLVELLRVEGLGPKRVKQVYETLGITTLEQLAAAAAEGKLRDLPGMGAKSEAKLVAALENLKKHGDSRTPLGTAWPLAQQILAQLAQLPGVTQTAIGGSLRRMKETIGDIDLLVAAADPLPIMAHFRSLENVASVAAAGPTKSRIVLHNGLGVDLRVLPAERWGTLLSYFTGSKEHNVRLRELALKKGYSLNEHAFTPLDGSPEILCATEEALYAQLGLPYISPVLREDRGEIEAGLRGELPPLIQTGDIQIDLHLHTTWSDGAKSVRQMAEAAKARGLKAIVVTDHSYGLGIANGLDETRLWQQAAEVRQVDEAMGPDFRVLHGTEMEIKADGSLDFPDEVLARLDFVIASLHVSLSQPREQVTQRALNAINNPHVDMLAHPTGRLLPNRPGADLDMEAVISAAAANQTLLEINANPNRLDLRDSQARRAIESGVHLAINCDAHHPDHFDLLHYGVATAQRAWATPAHIVNTWTIDKLLAYINR
ncbi:MAG: DNA polymerase/3'-5' exonuclease PolX [Anaerolineae bacterium]|nr:DNA polymerase/3'-5' exonuclease PolX [Anaerolineae bacterium]